MVPCFRPDRARAARAQAGDYLGRHLFNTTKWFANVPAVVVAAPLDGPAANRSAYVMAVSAPVYNETNAGVTLTLLANPITPGSPAAAAAVRKGGLADSYLGNATAGVNAVGDWPALGATAPLALSNITVFLEVRAPASRWGGRSLLPVPGGERMQQSAQHLLRLWQAVCMSPSWRLPCPHTACKWLRVCGRHDLCKHPTGKECLVHPPANRGSQPCERPGRSRSAPFTTSLLLCFCCGTETAALPRIARDNCSARRRRMHCSNHLAELDRQGTDTAVGADRVRRAAPARRRHMRRARRARPDRRHGWRRGAGGRRRGPRCGREP